ncbi:Trafficking protein particle complex subunit 1, partial [Mucuna pruriens]
MMTLFFQMDYQHLVSFSRPHLFIPNRRRPQPPAPSLSCCSFLSPKIEKGNHTRELGNPTIRMQFFGGSEISPSPPAPTASGNNGHMMYVFNRNGVCLLYREWNRPLRTLDAQQDHKLMFGLLFSLKSLTAKMDPTSAAEKGNLGVPQLPGQGCSFHSFRTNTYKLSFMESPSGIKIILVTHPRTGDLRESLKYIYNLYVEYVVKNPLYTPGSPIRCELFNTTLDQYVRGIA